MSMRNTNAPEYSRNYGFWNEAEQAALIDSTVAIAGVGGEGFIAGLELARIGVQDFDVADPEVFDRSNKNRVPGATEETIGQMKVDVFSRMVKEINPEATVRVYREGVTRDNVERLLGRAALVIDGSDLNRLDIGTMIAREARRRNIPDVLPMNIGFAAIVTSFDPQSRWTFERFMGIPRKAALDEIAKMRPNYSRCLPYVPPYGDKATLVAVQEGASLPSIVQGVNAAAAILTTQAFEHLVGRGNNRDEPIWAPDVAYFDAYRPNVIKHPRISHVKNLVKMLAGDIFHRNPRGSYRVNERNAREATYMNERIYAQLPVRSEV